MAKTPRTRHSTSKREPVTIDLEAVRADPPVDDAPSPAEMDAAVDPAESQDGSANIATDPEPVPPEASSDVTDGSVKDATGKETRQDGGSTEPPPLGGDAPRSGRRGGGALLGGLVGGVAALLLAGGLQYSGVLPPLNGAQQDDSGVEALRQELAGVQSELAELRAAPDAGGNTASLEEALAEPRQQIAELRETVRSLEQQMASAGGQGGEAAAALEQRLSELESGVQNLSQQVGEQGPADTGLAERLQSTETEVASLREAMRSVSDEGREAASEEVNEAVSAANARLDELAGSIDALNGRLEEIAAEVTRQDEGPKVALVVAASSLKSAVERGAPFASELETYSSLAPNAGAFDELRPYAEEGIPTLATLTEEATALAARIAAAENAPVPSAGFVDRLMSSARSVVTVRPVGEVAGEAPSAIAARMEAAVQRGDLDTAIAEYEALPPDMKQLGAEFADKLRARQAAEDILDQALSSALKPA
jgi:hypothetical protein